MIRDLKYWETLLVSSMMQRPIKKIIEEVPEIEQLQQKNLESALAFAALTCSGGISEKELYETIVEIPQYESKWLQLLDKENETELVERNFK
jgi:hypothetical protein